MKKKIFYGIPIVLLILGLLVPMIQAHKVNSHPGKSVASEVSDQATTAPEITTSQSASENKGEQVSEKDGSAAKDSSVKVQSSPEKQAQSEHSSNKTGTATVDSQSPQKMAAAQTVNVNIAVVGKEGELLFKPRDVAVKTPNSGSVTVLAALEATGVSYEVSGQWSGFVTAIAGQRNQGQAGWMFKVNDQILMVAADKKIIKAGDKVIWWYSKGMGTHSPTWKELTK